LAAAQGEHGKAALDAVASGKVGGGGGESMCKGEDGAREERAGDETEG